MSDTDEIKKADIRIDEAKIVSIKRPLLLTLLVFSFAMGVFMGWGMVMFTSQPAEKGEAAPVNSDGTFRFIRASVKPGEPGKNLSTRELKPFQYKVNDLVESVLKSGDVVAVSVYFRDLNNGNWFGIREREKFSQKNLLKLPLMIAYFKWAEFNPLVLRRTIPYTGKELLAEQTAVKPLHDLEPGNSYTVNDLIFRMIVYDDAAAYSLLMTNLPPDRLDSVFTDLDVEYNPLKKEDPISLSAFASFYRILFNASYLSEEMSEKALRYLTKSALKGGMASGIPPNMDIASKFGERTIFVSTGGVEKKLYQRHEFAIIYHPNRPFLIGIMVQGDDFDTLTKVVRDITNLVYLEVDQQS